MPVSKLRARLVSMAAELGIAIVGVDPASTSKWGAQYLQKPRTSTTRKTTRHAMRQLWRSAGAPGGTRPGGGQHRPLFTGANAVAPNAQHRSGRSGRSAEHESWQQDSPVQS